MGDKTFPRDDTWIPKMVPAECQVATGSLRALVELRKWGAGRAGGPHGLGLGEH